MAPAETGDGPGFPPPESPRMDRPPVPGGSSRPAFALTLLALLFFNGLNLVWLAADERPLIWDHHSHYTRGQKFAYLIRHGERLNIGTEGFAGEIQQRQEEHPALTYILLSPVRGFLSWTQGLYMGPKHPPLVHTLAGVWMAFFGTEPDGVVFFVNLLFSAILVFSVYGIASRFSGPWAGAVAAWTVVLLPGHFLRVHVLMLDFPLCATVALATYAVLRSDVFKDRTSSAAAGAALALGWLVKETFPVFLLPLIVIGILKIVREAREGRGGLFTRGGRGMNGLRAATVALLLCGFWFLPYLPRMPSILLTHQAMGGVERDPAWWEAAGALYYPCSFINEQASFLMGAALLCGLPLFVLRHRRHPWSGAVLLSFFVPMILFTFLSNKDGRYTLPVLPAAAVLTGVGLTAFRHRFILMVVPGLLVAAGVVQCLHLSFGVLGDIPNIPLVRTGGSKGGPAVFLHISHPTMRTRPGPAPRGAEALRAVIEKEVSRASTEGKMKLEVRHLFDIPAVTAPVEQALCWPGLDARYTGAGVRVRIRSGFFRPEREIERADLLLVKRKGTLGAAFGHLAEDALKVFDEEIDRFELVSVFPGPEGHFIEVYRPLREKSP
ncbi:MAG: ArnT family glycosyltransferase [Planctomycetota bacterium]